MATAALDCVIGAMLSGAVAEEDDDPTKPADDGPAVPKDDEPERSLR
jgi:hypothetical protein